jgi:Domain of unknown function (DUF397)
MLTESWCKASASNGSSACVEARLVDGGVSVRNSRALYGPVLRFNLDEWRAFVEGARQGEFDLPTE